MEIRDVPQGHLETVLEHLAVAVSPEGDLCLGVFEPGADTPLIADPRTSDLVGFVASYLLDKPGPGTSRVTVPLLDQTQGRWLRITVEDLGERALLEGGGPRGLQ